MEGFIGGRDKEVLGAPGGAAGQAAAIFNDGIEHLAIMSGDVLHVAHVFVAPFNLEGLHARVDQRAKVGSLIVIFHRQEVFIKGHHAALIVFQGIGQTAGLGAVAAVGAAPGLGVRDVALPGVGHAQRAVDKELDGGVGRLVNIADLIEVQLARQHNLGEPGIREKLRFLHAADIALGTGMQLNRRDIHLEDTHVLDD